MRCFYAITVCAVLLNLLTIAGHSAVYIGQTKFTNFSTGVMQSKVSVVRFNNFSTATQVKITSIPQPDMSAYKTNTAFNAYSTNIHAQIDSKQPLLSGSGFVLGGTPVTYDTNSYAFAAHNHGGITSSGFIGSTSGLPLITTTSGQITTGSFGTTGGTFAQGNDSRFTITPSFSYLPNATAQYYVPVSGTTPFTYGGVLATGTGSPVLSISPVFTGTPALSAATATTPSVNDNSTKVATTAYVIAQASASNPLGAGTASPGSALTWSKSDHVHPTGSTVGALYQKTADQAVASTTPVAITDVTWAIGASATQNFSCVFHTTNTATSLIRFSMNGPATPTSVGVVYRYLSTAYGTQLVAGAGAFSALATTTAAVTASVLTTGIPFHIDGSITNGTTAGTIQFYMIDSTTGQTNTLRKGSYCFVFNL